MMKRILAAILTLLLCLSCAAAEGTATPTDLPEDTATPTDLREDTAWDCPECGSAGNTGNFCPNCGAARPGGEAPAPAAPVEVGGTVTFGTWEQDDNKGNGAEPIEWLVLEIRSGRALVISRLGLVHARFADASRGQCWANSTLRGTLNYDFYNTAFTDEEKAAIRLTHLTEGEEQWDPEHMPNDRDAAVDTDDRIFVLSYAETVQYFPTEESRKCYCTEYVRKHANHSRVTYNDGRTCWYWLRSPAFSNNAVVVDWDGSIDTCYIHHAYGVARPACWVSLSALGLSAPADGTGTGEEESPETEAPEAGTPAYTFWNLVTFGHYEQDNDTENGPEPIEWRVLETDEEGGRVMLVARYALDCIPYLAAGTRTTWEECTLRAWLNGDFLNAAFTPEEQEAILLTEVDNSGRQNDPNFPFGTNDTRDRVFLLSFAEATRFMGTEESRRCAATAYAVARGAWAGDDDRFTVDDRRATRWWLRSPGRSRSNVVYAGTTGRLYDEGIGYTSHRGISVRPVIWVSLEALGT